MIIKKIDDLFEFLRVYTTAQDDFIFRGVKKSMYKLIPSVGRIKNDQGKPLTNDEEKNILQIFKYRAYPFIKEYKDDDIELLSIAQHHGLPTRMLDWTKNPLAGVYFSVEEPLSTKADTDTEYSCVYAYQTKKKISLGVTFDPFSIDRVKRYVPKHWDKRIISQSGLFTIHPNTAEPWTPDGLFEVLIHRDVRKQIKKVLNKMGVHAGTIYPDIDGIARHIKWMRSDEH